MTTAPSSQTGEPSAPPSPAGTPPPQRRRRIPRRPLWLAAAAVLAMAAGLLLTMPDDPAHPVIVAADDLAPGSTLTRADVTVTEITADEATIDQLIPASDFGAVDQWAVTTAVPEGAPIARGMVQRPSAPDDLRAMSVPLEPAQAVSGELERGDLVDLIEVRDGDARYLATQVQVLRTASDDAALGAGAGYALTVAVDSPTALDIARASEAAEVHVTRSTGSTPADVDDTPEPRTDTDGSAGDEEP